MTTVREFYSEWEDIEAKLIDLTVYPFLIPLTAELYLYHIYKMKKVIDRKLRNSTLTLDSEFEGIATTHFGQVTFEKIKKYVDESYGSRNERAFVKSGLVFSNEVEEDLNWFRQRGYMPSIK